MTTISNRQIGCADFRQRLIDRRGFLKAGARRRPDSAWPTCSAHEARAQHRIDAADSVIILWMRGGPSHIDMWDPKPDAPVEYRGEFGVMPTRTCPASCCPTCCRCPAGSWTSGRSSAACTTTTPATPPATRSASPATRPGPTPTRTSIPAAARSSSQQLGHLTPHLPAYVMIPRMVPGHRTRPISAWRTSRSRRMADPANAGPVPRAELRAARRA